MEKAVPYRLYSTEKELMKVGVEAAFRDAPDAGFFHIDTIFLDFLLKAITAYCRGKSTP